MKKKIYSEPAMTVEFFTPNQYVASCDSDWVPATQLGKTFWADVVSGSSYNYYIGKDDIINETNVEQFSNGHAPSGATGANAGILRGQWFENMTLYTKVHSYSYSSGSHYSDPDKMKPISGYENVAIYITKVGVAKVWIYTGNGGSKPTNPDWQNPGQTVNMS